jgi:hypothetical protein
MCTSDDDDDDDGDNGDGGGRGSGGEDDHNVELICLLGQQNSVMSGQGRPGTMLVIDTAVEGCWYTTRAAEFWRGGTVRVVICTCTCTCTIRKRLLSYQPPDIRVQGSPNFWDKGPQ